MRSLNSHRPRHSRVPRARVQSWLSNTSTGSHSSTGHVLFYLVLFGSEIALLWIFFRSGETGTWPLWKNVSIILANLFFLFMVGNHHSSRINRRLAANLILAGLSMLFLIGLSAFISQNIIGQEILVYAWGCVLLINSLRYYPGKRLKTRRRF